MNASLLFSWTLVTIQFFSENRSDFTQRQDHPEKIALSAILGDWRSEDTLLNNIAFIEVGSSYVEMRGIKHGVNYYNFPMTGDSIQIKGLAINWPPYYCDLQLVDATTLDIHFFQFNDTTGMIMRYMR